MISPFTYLVAGIIFVSVAVASVQTLRVNGLKKRAERAESLVRGYEDAAKIRSQQDIRQRTLREEASGVDNRILNREGGNAPLSDYLRDAAGDVWP